MTMHFDAIFYYVADLERAVRFYRDVLGFRCVSQDVVARFDVDGVLFEVVPTADVSKLRGGGNARMCLRVDDVQQTVAVLRSRGVACSEAEPKINGVLAVFHDSDGNELCLWQYT